MAKQLISRPLSEHEKEFYSVMKEHYTERHAALPDNQMIKRRLDFITKTLSSNEIQTYQRIQRNEPGYRYMAYADL